MIFLQSDRPWEFEREPLRDDAVELRLETGHNSARAALVFALALAAPSSLEPIPAAAAAETAASLSMKIPRRRVIRTFTMVSVGVV